MIARRADEIAAVTGGTVVAGDPAACGRALSIDSRTVAAGDVFFAIAGGTHHGHDFTHDGHAFAAAAAASGASIVVAARALDLPAGATLVRVADTSDALAALARDERRRRALAVVGITGSAGKTTTRALAGLAIAARRRAATSSGNQNNLWGVALTLLRLPGDCEVAVVEMGMNHPGEIAELTSIAEPDAGVVTNVGTAHIGFFDGPRALAAAKAELIHGIAADGTGIVHRSSPHLVELAAASGRRLVTFDDAPGADLVATGIEGNLLSGVRFAVEGVPVRLALWGRHAVLNALAALGAARAMGVPLADAAPALAELAPAKGRGRVVRLGGGIVAVDETYNANPSAVEAVLAGLAAAPWDGRRVAVLGDMLELGEGSPAYHRQVGEAAARAGIELLVAVGEFAGAMAEAARAAGVARTLVCHDAAAASEDVPSLVAPGDLVVVKGSRGVALEQVFDAIAAEWGGGAH